MVVDAVMKFFELLPHKHSSPVAVHKASLLIIITVSGLQIQAQATRMSRDKRNDAAQTVIQFT